MSRIKNIFLIVFWLLAVIPGFGQHNQDQEGYSNRITYTDTTFTKDTVPIEIDDRLLFDSRQFYDSIRTKAAQHKWFKRLHDYLIVETPTPAVFEEPKIDEFYNPYTEYKGKIIDSIEIRQVDVFGPTLSDTSNQTQQWYKQFGNFVHFPTNKRIIRENLLFAVRDSIDPALLLDNERILRKLRFIKDARIIVESVPGEPEKVKLFVLTQDLWSKGFNINMNSINAGQIELYDNNIFGIGHKLQGNIIFDYLRQGNPGIEAFYNISNFKGTFIDSRFYLLYSFETNRYGVELNRNFYSYKTKYIGGLQMYQTKTTDDIEKRDTTLSDIDLNFVEHDFWFGYAFPLTPKNGIFKKRTHLVLSARYANDRFIDGPKVNERYNYKYHDNYMFLGQLSYSRENFYESRMIYGFGRTEDIPVGDLYSLIFGWEADQFFQRWYAGTTIRHGHFFNNFGYLSSSMDIGGFIYENGFEQGAINFQAKYISKLFTVDGMQMRQFFDLHYQRGINRFKEERLEFDQYSDMRGYDNPSLYGKKKLVLRSETVGFSSLFYYGFRFAFFGFFDCGFIGSSGDFVLNNPIQTGFGLGMRMRNENLVFKTFQIRLGFYPSLSNGDNFLFYISGEKSLKPHRYTPGKPSKVEF